MKIMNGKKDWSSVGVKRETHDAFAEVCVDQGLKMYVVMDHLIEEWLKGVEKQESK
jgi:hypothetical protein